MRARVLLPLLSIAWLAACPPPPPDDAGLPDGGAPDAGASVDGGPSVDGGAEDAGPTGVDAGFDAGPPPPDPDAGPLAAAYWGDVGEELTDGALVAALRARLVEDFISLSYDALYDAYLTTDTGRGGCGDEIFDFYSTRCWAPDERCGNYNSEGDCFNREHSWPKNWWGGSESLDVYTDLVHVIPADGYVNNQRGNLPLGAVSSPTYTSTNGSRVGPCASAGATGNCFEPTDAVKGDLARIYFYMAVRYDGELDCCDTEGTFDADLDPWMEAVVRSWHLADPPDDAERARNEAVAEAQGTRNPFVDFPSWSARISDF